MEENYSSDLSLENGIELALKALAEVNEEGLEAEGVGMATIPTETALFAPVDVKEVARYIKKLKLVPKPNKDDKK